MVVRALDSRSQDSSIAPHVLPNIVSPLIHLFVNIKELDLIGLNESDVKSFHLMKWSCKI